jgi:hypothetical protein
LRPRTTDHGQPLYEPIPSGVRLNLLDPAGGFDKNKLAGLQAL